MERHFDEELKQLKEKLLKMSGLTEKAINRSVEALMDRDQDMAQAIIPEDNTINMLEIEIDDLCLRFLALHQPQAGDLRFITAIMRINNELERMGDLAVNIAQRVLDIIKDSPLQPPADIPKMAEAAQGMLKDSIDAFVNNDPKLAQAVCERDDIVDTLNKQIFHNSLHTMCKDPHVIERSVDFILVAKNLERIADLATNVCEDIIYMVDGKVIKHHIAD